LIGFFLIPGASESSSFAKCCPVFEIATEGLPPAALRKSVTAQRSMTLVSNQVCFAICRSFPSMQSTLRGYKYMTKMDAFRLSVAAIGAGPPEALSAYIEENHKVKIDPKAIPVFLASMRDLDTLTRLRQAAKIGTNPMSSDLSKAG
jgi:hypothetical protein